MIINGNENDNCSEIPSCPVLKEKKNTVWLHDTINTAWLTYSTGKRQSCSMRRAGGNKGEVKLEVDQKKKKKRLVITQIPALVVRRGRG